MASGEQRKLDIRYFCSSRYWKWYWELFSGAQLWESWSQWHDHNRGPHVHDQTKRCVITASELVPLLFMGFLGLRRKLRVR